MHCVKIRFMRLLLLILVSLPALWLGANYGMPAIAGIFLGVAWAFVMLMCAGIPFKWLMDLAKKIEDQGGSIFANPKDRDSQDW